MQAIKDLLASERGFIVLGVIIAATVLAAIAVITGSEWLDFARWVVTVYVASKTVTGGIQIVKTGVPDAATPAVVTNPANPS